MKIVITGGYGLKNLGDDALLVACCYLLENRKVEIFLHDPRNSYLPRFVSKETGRNYTRWEGKLSEADILVYGGGTLFYSYSEANIDSAFLGWCNRIIRGMKNPRAVHQFIMSWINAKKRFHKKKTTIMLGVGFGPFNGNELQERRALDLVRTCSDVLVRDKVSASLCQSADAKITLAHDLCLTPFFLEHLSPTIDNVKEKDGIVIIPRDWERETKGRVAGEKLKKAVEDYLVEDGTIRFVFFSKKEDENWKRLARELRERFGEEKTKIMEWDPDSNTIADFLTCLESCETVISMRYHGVIFSILKGLPVYSVPIDNKLIYLSERYSVPLWSGNESLRKASYDPSFIRTNVECAVLENKKALDNVVGRNLTL